jgi:hypothetical protein
MLHCKVITIGFAKKCMNMNKKVIIFGIVLIAIVSINFLSTDKSCRSDLNLDAMLKAALANGTESGSINGGISPFIMRFFKCPAHSHRRIYRCEYNRRSATWCIVRNQRPCAVCG